MFLKITKKIKGPLKYILNWKQNYEIGLLKRKWKDLPIIIQIWVIKLLLKSVGIFGIFGWILEFTLQPIKETNKEIFMKCKVLLLVKSVSEQIKQWK